MKQIFEQVKQATMFAVISLTLILVVSISGAVHAQDSDTMAETPDPGTAPPSAEDSSPQESHPQDDGLRWGATWVISWPPASTPSDFEADSPYSDGFTSGPCGDLTCTVSLANNEPDGILDNSILFDVAPNDFGRVTFVREGVFENPQLFTDGNVLLIRATTRSLFRGPVPWRVR